MAERRTTKKASGSQKKATRSSSTRKAGSSSARKPTARKSAAKRSRSSRPAGVEAKTVAEFRDALRKNLIDPTGMVMLTRERIEEALEGAVKGGQLSAKQARGIASELVKRGQKETNDVLKDLEGLLDRGRDELRSRASGARKRAVKAASPALAQADRARRAAGVGAELPDHLYDELNVAEVKARLARSRPPSCARCATTSVATASARACSARSSPGSSSRAATIGRRGRRPDDTHPPPPGRRARAEHRRGSRMAAPAWLAARATWSSCEVPCPATACGRGSPRPSARSPRPTRSSCSSPVPTGSSRSRRTPARPGRCCPTSASWPRRRAQVRDALERIGRFEQPPVESIVPAVEHFHYRNKLEYSFGWPTRRAAISSSASTAPAAST